MRDCSGFMFAPGADYLKTGDILRPFSNQRQGMTRSARKLIQETGAAFRPSYSPDETPRQLTQSAPTLFDPDRATATSMRSIKGMSRKPVAGIVDRVALLSKGGWDAFSKTPTASNAVISFRVELHLEPEPTRRRCADSHTAKGLPSPCGSRCS